MEGEDDLARRTGKTDLDDEDNDKGDVDGNEDGPEEPVRVEDSDNLQDESNADGQEDLVGGVGDVTVTELVNLEYHLVSQESGGEAGGGP